MKRRLINTLLYYSQRIIAILSIVLAWKKLTPKVNYNV